MKNPLPLNETAKLLKTIGYKGIETWSEKNFYETLSAAHDTGISLTAAYTALYTQGDDNYHDWRKCTREMISSSDPGTIFCFHIPPIESDLDSVKIHKMIVQNLREMTVYAASFGVKTCVYPHYNSYCETVARSVKLSQATGHKGCGAMLTLCHLLKVEGAENADKIIEKYADDLLLITISGADDGDTRSMAMKQLIQPLGEGSYDTYHVLELLWDNGFSGPVGIQFYGIKEDASLVIKNSVKVWNRYLRMYINKKTE